MKIEVKKFNDAFKNNNLNIIDWDKLSKKNILSLMNYNFLNQIIIKSNPRTFINFLKIIKNSEDNNEMSFEFLENSKEEYIQLSKYKYHDNANHIQKILNLYMGKRIPYTKRELKDYIEILEELNIDRILITKWCAKILVYTCENKLYKKEIVEQMNSGKLLSLINEDNSKNKNIFLNQIILKSNEKTLDLLDLIYEKYSKEINILYNKKLNDKNIWEFLKIKNINMFNKEYYITNKKNIWLSERGLALDFKNAPYELIDIYKLWKFFSTDQLNELINKNKNKIISCINQYENDNFKNISKDIISQCFEDKKFFNYVKNYAFQKELEEIIPDKNSKLKKIKL